jgi:predicted ATP-grasp superfamily ATP-dependent carboligase
MVLITDADSRGALSVIRSLGRKKVKTALLAQDSLSMAFFSRYFSESICCPSPRDDLHGFMKTLLRIVKTRKYASIFPLGDDSLLPISEHREKLAPYVKLALPSHGSVLTALNKAQTLRVADEAGIPTPQTFHVKNTAEVKDLSTRIQYPSVIKPKWSYVWKQNGKAQYARPFFVNSASELISTYVKVDENFPIPLIQDYVPGHNISVALLFDHGEPKAACCIRVYRAKPITGGQSVLRESIQPDLTLLRYASDLLRSLQWHGVAEVEFRAMICVLVEELFR